MVLEKRSKTRIVSIAGVAILTLSLFVSGPVRAGELVRISGHRALVVAIEVDRDGVNLVGFTSKDRAFVAPVEVPLAEAYSPGGLAQIEVVLLGPTKARYTQRITVGGLCLDHGPEAAPEIQGDTFRLHRESFLVEEPEIALFDRIEVAYYPSPSVAPGRKVLGTVSLDSAHFTSAGTKIRYQDLAIAKGSVEPSSTLTPGTIHFPEEFGDTDIYTVYGNEAEQSKRINVVIVPDGYTYAQKATLQSHAQAMVDAFRAKSPYKEHDRFLNYILVYAYSTEDGTDQCDCSIVRDTAMSTRFPLVTATCGHDDNRCLSYGAGCDPTDSSAHIATAELRAPAQDTTVVMVNTTRYGGCGGARAVYSAANSSATEIAIHELGHSLAHLDDEYGGDPSCGSGSGINTSMDSTNGSWPEWIADLGAPHEGAKYYDRCIYRPIDSCEMRTLGPEFCPVCKQQWALTYFGHPRINPTAPLESQSVSPAFTNVGMPLTFSLGTRLSSGVGVTHDFTWKLLGPGFPVPTTVATGIQTYTRSFSPSGAYTLTSEIVADTNFIKPSKNGPNVDTASWTANVCDPTQACGSGGPYVVECSGVTEAIPLHGSVPTAESVRSFWTTSCPGSSIGDPTVMDTTLALAPVACPMPCSVTLNAVHDCSTSYVCTSTVTVRDTTPPAVHCPADVTVECSALGGTPASDPTIAGFLASGTSQDVCDPAPHLANNAPALFPVGVTPVTFTATDACGNVSSCVASVHVADTVAPTISFTLSPHVLSPANGQLRRVVATVAAADVCSAPTVALDSIISNFGGSGIADADYGTPDFNLLLRAQTRGAVYVRTYTVTYSASDGSGNRATARYSVFAPPRP